MEKCPKCDGSMELRNLVQHLRNVHKQTPEDIANFRKNRKEMKKVGKPLFQCSLCSKSYLDSSSVRRHMTTEHNSARGTSYIKKGEDGVVETGDNKFTCVLCDDHKFSNAYYLNKHQRLQHPEGFPANFTMKQFADRAEFQEWLERICTVTATSLFIRTSHGEANRVVHYRCQHEGKYECTATVRAPKITKKLQLHCPTFVKATFQNTGEVLVDYFFEHNHKTEISKLKMTDSQVQYIKRLIENKIVDREILERIRQDFCEKDRIFYTSMKDIRNLKDRMGLLPANNTRTRESSSTLTV